MKRHILTNQNFQIQHQAFTKRKELEGKSNSHIASTTNLSKEFLHYLENQNNQDINQEIIDNYFEYLQKRNNDRRPGGLSSNYLDKHKEAVLRFIEFIKGVDVGQSGIYIQKFQKDKTPKEILTEEEVQILFSQTDNTFEGIKNRTILSLLYGCGLRKGELHQLNIENIDMAKDVVRIEKTKTSKQRDRINHSQFMTKTGLSRRIISETIQNLIIKQLIRVTDYKGNILHSPELRKGKMSIYYAPLSTRCANTSTKQCKQKQLPVQNKVYNKTNYSKLKRQKDFKNQTTKISDWERIQNILNQ